jgi:chaperonin GroES
MKLRPLGNNLLVRPASADDKIGSIVIPDTVKGRPHRGTVVAAGPGARTESGMLIENSIQRGDLVLFGEGLGVEVEVDGEKLLFMSEDGVLGIIEEG